MAVKIYIDGQEGTTGLKILERFEGRNDIELLKISEDKRKDLDERKKFINASDFTFLCLPDAAAIEAVSLIENENTIVIDTSTAHRTDEGWAYGFPELSENHKEKLKNGKLKEAIDAYNESHNAGDNKTIDKLIAMINKK